MVGFIRVVLADAHPVCVKGVQVELSMDGVARVVGSAFDSTQLFDVLEHHECDVLVSDYALPGTDFGDGLSMFEHIQQRYPALGLVVLTSIDNPMALRALELRGVRAIVSKRDLPEHLRQALRAASRGGAYRSPRIREALGGGAGSACATPPVALTGREVEVVRLFASGYSLGEIAEKFRRSKKAISAQKRAAMRKLNVRNDMDLLSYGLQNGLAA
ncbi:response regulator transcription factor [Achromobacter seleniivolatilans]|uniref:Response regulator transcription factor n=1 Tax=Achromobacter seleniivolatilans TaxID=3047478 RepID=A0ABY9LV22_9BURK|nr:response regulator transcription factor [Achromobacter sp. R39]WMD18639.1 response regulator transcription factor [Achromobacter sp. R39]